MLVLKMMMLCILFLWMMACTAQAKDAAECPAFTRVSPGTEKKVSACPSVTGDEQVYSLGECKKLACSKGGNAFEIDLTTYICRVKKCDPSNDPKLTTEKGLVIDGKDVYLIDTESSKDDTGCSWTLKYPATDMKMANCGPNLVWPDKAKGLSTEDCQKLACTQGGNTVNYNSPTKDCLIKMCDPSDNRNLPSSSRKGYDIYTRGSPGFTLASPQSAGKASHCTTVASTENAASVEECKKLAHKTKGANTFAFKGKSCYVKTCDPASNLKLTSGYGGYDIYKIA